MPSRRNLESLAAHGIDLHALFVQAVDATGKSRYAIAGELGVSETILSRLLQRQASAVAGAALRRRRAGGDASGYRPEENARRSKAMLITPTGLAVSPAGLGTR